MGEKWGGGRSAKSRVTVVARLFLVPILKIVVQLWPPEEEWQHYQVRHKEGEKGDAGQRVGHQGSTWLKLSMVIQQSSQSALSI